MLHKSLSFSSLSIWLACFFCTLGSLNLAGREWEGRQLDHFDKLLTSPYVKSNKVGAMCVCLEEVMSHQLLLVLPISWNHLQFSKTMIDLWGENKYCKYSDNIHPYLMWLRSCSGHDFPFQHIFSCVNSIDLKGVSFGLYQQRIMENEVIHPWILLCLKCSAWFVYIFTYYF